MSFVLKKATICYNVKSNIKLSKKEKPFVKLYLRTHEDNYKELLEKLIISSCKYQRDPIKDNLKDCYWHNMIQYEICPLRCKIGWLILHIPTQEDLDELNKVLQMDIKKKSSATISTYYKVDKEKLKFYKQKDFWQTDTIIKPKYPIYILSKGRPKLRMTPKFIEEMGLNYFLVIEEQELVEYAKYTDQKYLLPMPKKLCNLGQGGIPARNFIWQHSIDNGHKKHWILDDNIAGFHRLNKNCRRYIKSGAVFKIIEDYTDLFKNVRLSGMQYSSMVPEITLNRPPVIINSRIYSCILIDNSLPFRWRGKYNEDTDLSLRVLKQGDYTILFNCLQCNKQTSGSCKGGNQEIYKGYTQDGYKTKFMALKEMHPLIVEKCAKFGKEWHHFIDYKKHFKKDLIIKDDKETFKKILGPTNDYGLKIINT
tara:strand:- start:4630 stop:5901 length:1272 start_codon:yes stop_codon:yes gene_type:complete